MIKDLSAREKVMLYILALFLLGSACLYFVIMPTAAQTAMLRDAVEKTREMARTMEDTIAQAQTLAGEAEKLRLETDALAARQMPYTSNSELDELITGIIINCGMNPFSLELGTLREAEVLFSGMTLQQAAENPPPLALQNTIDAVFSGSLTTFARFIDSIDSIDSVRITRVNYNRQSGTDDYTFSVGLVVYMNAE